NAMLGAEQRRQLDAFGLVQKVNRCTTVAVLTRVIRHQSNTAALQALEVLTHKDIDSGEHYPVLVARTSRRCQARKRCCLELCELRRQNSGSLPADARDVAFTIGMQAIAQEDDRR